MNRPGRIAAVFSFVAVACIAAAASPAAENLVKNGSFEDFAGAGKAPDGWWGDGTKVDPSSDAKHGSKSLHIKSSAQGWFTYGQNFKDIPAGTVLTIGCWTKTSNMVNGKESWERCKLTLEFKKTGGKDWFNLPELVGNNDWKWYEGEATVPEGTTEIVLSLGLNNTSGEAWYDNVIIVKGKGIPDELKSGGGAAAPAGPANLIKNAGFDQLDGDKPKEWTIDDPNKVKVSSDIKRGPKSVNINSGNQTWVGAKQKIEGLAPGDEYVVAVWAKSRNVVRGKEAWENARLGFEITKDSGKEWPAMAEMVGTTDWKRYEMKGKVPAGTKEMWMTMGMNNASGEAWFDSPFIVKGTEIPPDVPAGGAVSATKAKEGGTTILLGTWGSGFFRLSDSKWESTGKGLPRPYIQFVSADPSGVLLCGTGDREVYRSEDNGSNWTKLAGTTPTAGTGAALDPSEPKRILLTTWGDGAWWSADGGASWQAGSSPSKFMRRPIVGVSAGRGEFFAIADDNRIVRARTFMGNWENVGKLTRGLKAWDLAHREVPRALLIATDAGVAEMTMDGKYAFPRLSVPTAFARGVAVDGDRVLIGTLGTGVVEWKASGAARLNDGLTDKNAFALIASAKSKGVTMAAATEAGPPTWTDRSAGLASRVVTFVLADPRNEKVVLCSTKGGISRSTDGGLTWTKVSDETGVRQMIHDPSSASVVYYASSGGVYKSTDGGMTWNWKNNGITSSDVYWIAVDPVNSSVVFAMTWGVGVWRSKDGGENWASFSGGLNGTNGYVVEAGAKSPYTIFAGMDSIGLFRLDNDKWRDANKGVNNLNIWDLSQNPFDGNTWLMGVYNGGVYRSPDNGDSWKLSDKGLTNPYAYRVSYSLKKKGVAYVATRDNTGTSGSGVFRTADGGDTWTQWNEGLQSQTCGDLHVTGSGLIFLGTTNGLYVRQD